MKKWECTICGYIHEGENPPDECPLCGAGPEYFEELVEASAEVQSKEASKAQPEAQTEPTAELATNSPAEVQSKEESKAQPEEQPATQPQAQTEPTAELVPDSPAAATGAAVKKWECTVCGYIHEGPTPPDACPVCGVGPEYFKEIVEKEVKTMTEKVIKPEEDARKKAAPSLFRTLVMKHHLHPIAVHTPNGVLPLALIFLAVATVFGSSSFEQAAFYSLVFVLINMPFVIATGYIAWQERYRGAKTKIFGIKIGGTIVVCATLLCLIVWRLIEPGVASSPGRWTYLLICLICVAGAGLAGHMGGKLVFGSRDK